MKCPNCNYVDGPGDEGEKGEFYHITNLIKMKRDEDPEDGEDKYPSTQTIIGCPNCNLLFMDYD